MNKKPTTIKIVELNNKSRKGTYYSIKLPGKKTIYYKSQPGIPVDYYLRLAEYKEKLPNKRRAPTTNKWIRTYQQTSGETDVKVLKPSKEVTRDAERYIKKIRKQYRGKTITNLLKKGITATVINDTLKTTQKTIETANKKLLNGLILDKKLLDIMSTEENMQKMKNRLEQRIEVKDNQGRTIIECNKIGQTTRQTINEINQLIRRGEETTGTDYKGGEIKKRLEINGWQGITEKESGKVNRIQLTTILRKGK